MYDVKLEKYIAEDFEKNGYKISKHKPVNPDYPQGIEDEEYILLTKEDASIKVFSGGVVINNAILSAEELKLLRLLIFIREQTEAARIM